MWDRRLFARTATIHTRHMIAPLTATTDPSGLTAGCLSAPGHGSEDSTGRHFMADTTISTIRRGSTSTTVMVGEIFTMATGGAIMAIVTATGDTSVEMTVATFAETITGISEAGTGGETFAVMTVAMEGAEIFMAAPTFAAKKGSRVFAETVIFEDAVASTETRASEVTLDSAAATAVALMGTRGSVETAGPAAMAGRMAEAHVVDFTEEAGTTDGANQQK